MESIMKKPVVIREADCELQAWNDDVRGSVSWRTLISGDITATHGLTCGVAELAPGGAQTASLHQHQPVEIYYILAGEGRLTVNGEEYDVSAGSTAFIPENAIHGLVNTGIAPLRLFYVFPVDAFSDVEYQFPDGSTYIG